MASPFVYALHGILVFQLVCTLFFFGNTRQKQYLYYACYLLAALVYFVYIFHWQTLAIAPKIPRLLFAELFQWLAMLIYIAYSLFLDAFLQTATRFPRIYYSSRFVRWFCSLYCITDAASIIILHQPLNPAFYWISSVVVVPVILVACYDIYKKRNALLLLLLTGMSIVVIFSAVSSLLILLQKWSDKSLLINPLQLSYTGVVLETIFFSTALLYKILYTERQKLAAEKELHRQAEENKNLQLQLYEMRYKISADLHDQVGSTLYSVSLYSQMARSSMSSPAALDKVRDILSRIENSSTNMLTEMNDIVWTLNPVNDSWQKLTERITNFAQGLCLPANILPHINFIWQPDLQISDMQKRKNLYLVIKEAITNSVKYSGAASLQIKGWQENNLLHIVIQDEGKGFCLNTTTGNGLQNIQRRIQEAGGTVTITTAPEAGTTVAIEIQLP
jgi:signal transduction histidine kinase